MKMNRQVYEKLIAEDLAWLSQQPRTLEREHIQAVLQCSADRIYGRLLPDVIEQEHAECFVAKEGAPLSTSDDCETDGWYGCDYCARKKPQEPPVADCDACYAGKPVRCEKTNCPRVS